MHNPSVAGMLPKRDWLEMTSEDFSQGNPSRWTAVLPIAAVEQHGPHLSLGTDAFVAETYLARVREGRLPSLRRRSFRCRRSARRRSIARSRAR
jgi:Creatinine amidohydrolase